MTDGAQHRRAEQRRGWWPGWIWSVPLAALGLVAWLAVRSWTQSGPTVTVVFPMVADLRPDDTTVTFEGYKVGQVSAVTLEPDLRHMRAKLQLDADMRGDLGKGTQFWIIGRSPSIAHLSDIKALLSGVSIGIRPAPGTPQHTFEGLAQDPVLSYDAKGTMLTLHADKLGSIQAATPIYYLGEKVGEVQATRMTGARGFSLTAFIDSPFDQLVHDGSRFWRAGPIHLSTGGNGPSVQFQSVPALFQGAIDFETPQGAAAGPVAAGGHDFTLYDDEDSARNAPDAAGVAYRAVFPAASGVPDADAPVTLMGKRIGSVSDSALQYDAKHGALDVAVTMVIEPRSIARADGAQWGSGRAQMDDMLRTLIGQGLRATLTNSPPVLGSEQVALRMVPGEKGTLGDGPVPEIPTTQGGSVSGLIAQASGVVAKIDAIPLDQISQNLTRVSEHLSRLTGSPAIGATLDHVDHATADVQRVADEMRRKIPPEIDALRGAITEARASLASARDVLSSQGNVANTPGSADLPQTLYEVTRAARALREFSDFLDRHPSAPLTGRTANE